MRQIFAALMMGITCATVGRAENIVVELRAGVAMEFVWIEPGTFLMGSPASSPTRGEDEGPQHEVSINKGFYLGKFEITQAQWVAVMGTAPWTRRKYVQAEPNHPVAHSSPVAPQGLAGAFSPLKSACSMAKRARAKPANIIQEPIEESWFKGS